MSSFKIVRALIIICMVTVFGLPAFAADCDSLREQLRQFRLAFRDKSVSEAVPKGCDCKVMLRCYYREGNQQTVDSVMLLWRLVAIREWYSDDLNRAELLLAIDRGESIGNRCDSTMIDRMLRYKQRLLRIRKSGYGEAGGGCYGSVDSLFDEFLSGLASKNASKLDTMSSEYLLCRFFGGDVDLVFDRLQAPAYAQTELGRSYGRCVTDLMGRIRRSGDVFSFWGGMWIPTGSTRMLGNQQEAGVSVGTRTARYRYDFVFAYRFGKADKPYVRRLSDSLRPTQDFGGGYFGFDLGRNVWQTRRTDLDLVTGIGWDVIGSVQGDDGEQIGLGSFNFNMGGRLRFYMGRHSRTFLGIQARYSMVGYNTHGGTELSGNTITLNAIFGYVGSSDVTRELKLLNH